MKNTLDPVRKLDYNFKQKKADLYRVALHAKLCWTVHVKILGDSLKGGCVEWLRDSSLSL